MADQTDKDMIIAVREIIFRAILTFKALPDREARYLRQGTAWAGIVGDANLAYGYGDTFARAFQPTPYEMDQAMEVSPWLAWLWKEEGDIAVKRIIARAMGIPLWRLAERERCGEKTITNRIDRSVAAIIGEFFGKNVEIEIVEEPYEQTPFAMVIEKPAQICPEHKYFAKVMKVYVHGKGMMLNGRIWRDGRHRAEKYLRRA